MAQEPVKETVDAMDYLFYISSESFQSEPMSDEETDETNTTDVDIMIEDEDLIESFRSPRYIDEDCKYDISFPFKGVARRMPYLEIRSCINFSSGGNSSPQLSARSAFSCNTGAKHKHFKEGNLWKFYSPQCGYVELKRCNSEIKLDIRSHETNFDLDSSSDDDASSSCSYRLSVLNIGEGETSYNNMTDYFFHDMNELSDLFANLTISFGRSPCRVKKIFNLDTWLNAIYELPKYPGGQATIWPMEKAWMFIEFCRNTRTNSGKRFADWYTTEQVPEEKKRK